jgi:hypothetical protein
LKTSIPLSLTLFLAPGALPAQTLTIDHRPVGCAVAEKFPKFDARFAPAEGVANARVVFQPEKSDQWWSVAMKLEGNAYVGVLPRPKSSLKSFQYYIEVTGKSLETARTPDYSAAVVSSSGACQGKLMSGALSSAAVILQGPAGVAAIPAGFASTGVVAGASSAGAAGGAGAASAGGGGLGAGAIIAGVGLAAAGVAVAAVVPKNEDSSSGNSPAPSPTPQTTYDVVFTPPATLNLIPCGANSGITGLAGIQTDSSGAFNSLQTQVTPVMRVTGQATSTTFNATLACTNGAVTGSLSATGGPNSYSGTFSFGSSSGGLTVTKR